MKIVPRCASNRSEHQVKVSFASKFIWTDSVRGVLGVMPSKDLRAYGFTIGWWFFGVMRAVKRAESNQDTDPASERRNGGVSSRSTK